MIKSFRANILMKKICKKHKITFIDFSKMNEKERPFSNGQITDCSFCTYDEIFLGLYKDKEKRLASFFHELGHILNLSGRDENAILSKYEIEMNAWATGFSEAAKYNIRFRHPTLQWCTDQLQTYEKSEFN